MKTRSNTLRLFLFAAATAAFPACSSSDDPAPVPLTATTVKDVAADPTSTSSTGQPVPGTNKFTFYSMKNNAIVPNADSASTKWDVAFRGTTIITNGGTSGPGQGGVSVQSGIFDDIKTVPATATFTQDSKAAYGIPSGSGNGWYNYNPATNIISPIAGKVFLLKTAEGKYAKMEILSYYKGAPATPAATDASRYYTFRYLYQPDGSTNLQ